MVGSYDLGRNAAAPLGATRLVRQRLPDKGKSRPLGPGFLDGSVSQGQPLPWPATRRGLGWAGSSDAHHCSGELVTRPAVHAIENIRRAGEGDWIGQGWPGCQKAGNSRGAVGPS
jgi:hypothetical protein